MALRTTAALALEEEKEEDVDTGGRDLEYLGSSDDASSVSSSEAGGEVSEVAFGGLASAVGRVIVDRSSGVKIGGTHIHVAAGSHLTLALPAGPALDALAITGGSAPALGPPGSSAPALGPALAPPGSSAPALAPTLAPALVPHAAQDAVQDQPQDKEPTPSTESTKRPSGKEFLFHGLRMKVATGVLVALCLIVVLALSAPEWIYRADLHEDVTADEATTSTTPAAVTVPGDPTSNSTDPGGDFVIPRAAWEARKPRGDIVDLRHPASHVLAVGLDKEWCKSVPKCAGVVRALQTSHMDGFAFHDIAYNFVVGLDESVFEGRGWDAQACLGSHFGYNAISIGYVGGLLPDSWSKRSSTKKIVALGVRLGALTKDVVYLDKWSKSEDGREERGNEGSCRW